MRLVYGSVATLQGKDYDVGLVYIHTSNFIGLNINVCCGECRIAIKGLQCRISVWCLDIVEIVNGSLTCWIRFTVHNNVIGYKNQISSAFDTWISKQLLYDMIYNTSELCE